jgi:hypothetical protein
MTHTIRLRGFWTAAEVGPGVVRHARRFGRPRTLDPGEAVWLVGDAAPGDGTVSLNGKVVGDLVAGRPFAVKVTGALGVRNEVWLEVRGGGAVEEVVMEIRSTG